jgi:hypothetical protein
MGPIVEFLNQPIVLTIITLAIGGYLVSTITDRRARKDKRREKAIDFLTDTGSTLNAIISTMYATLRRGKPYTDEAATEAFTDLFGRRMNIRVASEAYLNSELFPTQYDQVLHELQAVAHFLRSRPKEPRTKRATRAIHERRVRLREAWPIANEPSRPATDSANAELMLWLDMILDRVTAMLSSTLNAVMR